MAQMRTRIMNQLHVVALKQRDDARKHGWRVAHISSA
jgi:hypothetical protein